MDRIKRLLNDSRVSALFAVFIAAVLGSGVSIAVLVDDDNDPATPAKPVVTIPLKLPGQDAKVVADKDQEISPAQVVEAGTKKATGQAPSAPDFHEDTRDETPPGVSPQEIVKGELKTERQRLKAPERPAGAQNYSCPNAYVRNQSGLSGKRVGVALHFTVSGTGSLNAIRGLFDRASFGASSNRGIETFGRCQTWVPRNRKAWAQGAANSAYFSYEIISFDRSRASWLSTAIIKRGILAGAVADDLKIIGAPPKLVDPSGCTWLAGVVDHNRLECGNTHWDVGANFPWDVFMAQVRRAYSGATVVAKKSPLTKAERKIVNRVAFHKAKGPAKWLHYWCVKNTAARHAIDRAKARDRKPYSFRKRGSRRATLLRSFKKYC